MNLEKFNFDKKSKSLSESINKLSLTVSPQIALEVWMIIHMVRLQELLIAYHKSDMSRGFKRKWFRKLRVHTSNTARILNLIL